MRLSFQTTTSIFLLFILAACSSLPTKETSQTYRLSNIVPPTSALDPLNVRTEADYNYILGELYSRDGESDRSIAHLEKVLTFDDYSPAVHMHLSSEYLKTGQLKKALLHVEKALAKDPQNIEAHLVLGGLYSQEKLFDKALTHYKEVLKLQPNNTEAPMYMGSLYTEQKDYKKAEYYFRSLLKNPNYATPHVVHYYLGLLEIEHNGSKGYVSAEKAFRKSLEIKADYEDAAMSLAKLYLQQRNPNKALSFCYEFQKTNPFNQNVADLIAQILIEQGNTDQAYQQLEYIAGHTQDSLEVQMKMAMLLIEQKHLHQAAAKLKDIISKYPNLDSARYYLAAIYQEIGATDNAVIEYMQVPPTSPHFSEAVVQAANILKSLGKLNQALDVTEKGLKLKGEIPQIYTLYASLLDAKSDYLGALRILEKGLSKFAQNAGLLFQYAITLDRLGKKEGMIAQLKKVLELDPEHVDSMSYLAFSFAELNEHLTEAEGLARRAFALQPTNGYVADTLGWVLFKQKKFSEAIHILEKAYSYESSESIIAEHLADAYLMESMTEKAQKMYDKAAVLTTDETKARQIRSKLQKLVLLHFHQQ